ncbi:helix-turn-helix transcriptional regulator [Georgenia sp. MJ170]|uniref:helix-turn-helix transcriptional regulator n=1 Tax=Georgenia sunbinii TaxID=3117728 RepID=UPI002F2618B4
MNNEKRASGTTAAHTPATARFTAALDQGDWPTALAVLDEHWMEIWYAIDPAELRHAMAQAPPHLLATEEGAGFVARVAGHGAVEDLLEPERRPGRNATPEELAKVVADLRLRGRPVAAMAYVRRGGDLIRAQAGRLVDSSGGTMATWLVQAAITALLAGDRATATGMLLGAVDTHRPERFPFIVREATAKLALLYAVTGDVAEAAQVNQRASEIPRSPSWVEALVDDTIELTDYICAVDTLHPRAEDLRLANSSPLAHLEFWPVALTAHVRHLVLTGRPRQAEALCDAVTAAGMPPSDADGLFASAIPEARLLTSTAPRAHRDALQGSATAHGAQAVLARARQLFTTAQFAAVLRLDLPPSFDDRAPRAMALLRAQATIAEGRVAEGRRQLLTTLREVLDRQTYSTLRYLSRETLHSISETEDGARATELVDRAGLATLEVQAVLTAPLSEAEIEVLRLLREGLPRDEMAARLFLSVNTVKSQLRSAYRKLGVTARDEALDRFAQLGS